MQILLFEVGVLGSGALRASSSVLGSLGDHSFVGVGVSTMTGDLGARGRDTFLRLADLIDVDTFPGLVVVGGHHVHGDIVDI